MEEFELKYKKKKIYIISLLALIIILRLIIFATDYSHMGFYIGKQNFRYVEDDWNEYVFKDKEGNLVSVARLETGQGAGFFSFADKYKVSYLDKIIYSDSSNMFEEGWQITLADGNIYEKHLENLNSDGWEENSSIFDLQLIEGIESVISFKTKMIGWFAILIFGTIFMAIGLLGIIYPVEVWRFQYCFSVSGGEPTGFAINSNRFVGIVMILTGLFFYPIVIC